VFPLVIRRVLQPINIGGYDLSPGIFVASCIFLAHRRASIWPDPEEFKPERFLEKRPPSGEYFPFGGGVHGCIGPAFSEFEMKIVLIEVLLRFTLRLDQRSTVRIVRRGFTFAPSSGLLVQARSLCDN
jgi:cytochrome P450